MYCCIYAYCLNLGTIVNNMEGSGIPKSSHFNMASQLLEVWIKVERKGWCKAHEYDRDPCVCDLSGGSQSAGEQSDSALLHDYQGECDQIFNLCSGCGWQGCLCQSKISPTWRECFGTVHTRCYSDLCSSFNPSRLFMGEFSFGLWKKSTVPSTSRPKIPASCDSQ